MGRIIPWDMPEVNGGSIGGYTPEPTPTPDPLMTNPYDFTDFVITGTNTTAEKLGRSEGLDGVLYSVGKVLETKTATMGVSVSVSGVKLIDTSNVGQVIAHCSIDPNNFAFVTKTNYLSATKAEKENQILFDVDISAIMTTIGGTVTPNSDNSTYVVCGHVITAQSSVKGWYFKLSSGTFDIVSVDVYNANGVPLQTWTPPEVEE